MELALLEEIGLTKGEIAVYTALLDLGPTKTGPLAARAGVSSSKVYKILARLQKKGLSGFMMREGVKYFSAQHPRRIIDYIEEREKQLEKRKADVERIIPELERRQASEKTNATVYEGFRAVTNIFRSVVDELKPGEGYCVIGATYGELGPELRRFFYKHHQRRAEKGIDVRMLANYGVSLEETTLRNAEVRYLPQYFVNDVEIIFYGRKTFLVMFSKEPTGVLIENSTVTRNFENYFKVLWKISKPMEKVAKNNEFQTARK